MKKSPTFRDPIICADCFKEVKKTGTAQKYCGDCAKKRDAANKNAYMKKVRAMKPKTTETAIKKVCTACGEIATSSFEGKPYCRKHKARLVKTGSTELTRRKSTNTFGIVGDDLVITTKNGDLIFADADDAILLSKFSWSVSKAGYAAGQIAGRGVYMHRYIVGLDNCAGAVIDHKDGNRLNNRRSNLRICTQAENNRNHSITNNGKRVRVGVDETNSGKYSVRIGVDGKKIGLGSYLSLQEAVEVRVVAENKYHGIYGCENSRVLTEY